MIEYTVRVDEYSTRWYLNGQLHRVDGPAREYAYGYKSWWLNGQLHREDGPAIERADGSTGWCLRNVPMTKEQFQAVVKNKRFTSEEIESLKSYGIEI